MRDGFQRPHRSKDLTHSRVVPPMSERTRVPQPVQLRSRSFDRWPSSSGSEGECEKGLHALAGGIPAKRTSCNVVFSCPVRATERVFDRRGPRRLGRLAC